MSNDDLQNIINPNDYEDIFDSKASAGGGGGTKKNKDKYRGKKTSQAIIKETIENSIENRIEKSLEKLERVLKNLDLSNEEKREKYLEWLQKAYTKKESLFEDHEIEESFVRSSGPGGQNTNKVNSAVNLKHIPTHILVENQESRDQPQNRENARNALNEKLEEHLLEWKSITGDYYNEKRVNTILNELKK